MSVETELVTLLQDAGLTVYPLSIPEGGAFPCVVYQRISTPQIRSHEAVEMEHPRIQLACWGKTFAQAVVTAETVKTALDLNQIDFKLAVQEGELDLKEPESNLYRRVLDFFIWT